MSAAAAEAGHRGIVNNRLQVLGKSRGLVALVAYGARGLLEQIPAFGAIQLPQRVHRLTHFMTQVSAPLAVRLPQLLDWLVANDGLLEWASYAGNRYGTPRAPVEEQLEAGSLPARSVLPPTVSQALNSSLNEHPASNKKKIIIEEKASTCIQTSPILSLLRTTAAGSPSTAHMENTP